MATLLNPYLSFDGDAREAMQFYEHVFGGELSLHTFGEIGPGGGEHADRIMHGTLSTAQGFTLMASDMPPGTEHHPGNTFAVSLSGDDERELRGFWDQLSDGGTVAVPLERQVWGDVFGMCTDRFGVTWMVDIAEPQH